MNLHYQRGGSLVEFAIVAEALLILFIGAIAAGWMLFAYHATDYGARVGARWASVRGASCTNTSGTDAQGNTLCPASTAAVQYFVLNQVPGLSSTATVTTQWSTPPSTWANAPSSCSQANEAPGCIVQVTVANPIKVQIPFVYTGTITLQSQSQSVISE